jgi:hypothetical protein
MTRVKIYHKFGNGEGLAGAGGIVGGGMWTLPYLMCGLEPAGGVMVGANRLFSSLR